MGELVFAGALSHAPGIAAFATAPKEDVRERFFRAADVLRMAVERARPDVLVVVAPDHFSNFFVDNMPAACVTTNDVYRGPVEDWLGIPPTSIAGAPGFANSILTCAYDAGVEPSVAGNASLDHGVMVALKLVAPRFDVPIVWIMQNCQVPPLMSLSRCYDFGRAIRTAVDASGLRVGVIGTGGLSHAPGSAEADTLDPEFDREFLSLLERNAIGDVLAIPDSRLDAAGFGTWEIRLWVTALGVAHDRKPRPLAYEPVHEWDTGCAVALFE